MASGARGSSASCEEGVCRVSDGRPWGDVVTVVIDAYDHLPRLRKLRREASRVHAEFVAAGFTPVADDLVADGTARAVIDALREWRPEARRLVVYWGGHGKALTGSGYYLCCRDTPKRTEVDRHTAVSATELGERLAAVGVAEIVLLLDACGSGGGGDEITAAFKAKVSRTPYAGFRPSLSVISSASHLEKATERAFTAAMSTVLRGGAPLDDSYLPWTDRDSHISPTQLAQAVRVVLARDSRNIQVPDHSMSGMIDRFFPNPRFRSNVPDVDLDPGGAAALGRPLLPQDVTDHFMVKFRGIDSADDQGWYFTGRHRVLRHIVSWLSTGSGMLVVTGGAGCGKSALLGRLAVLSVSEYRAAVRRQGGIAGLPEDTVPRVGAIDAGVHAKHKSLLDCVAELAGALAIPVPPAGWQAPAELLLQIAARKGTTTVLLDALDEATEISALATDLLRPLAELPKVRVLVGTRRARDGSDLLNLLGAATDRVIRLDSDVDRTQDIEEYVRRRLLGTAVSPYRGRPDTAGPAARRIAEHSAGVFLFARLLAGLFAHRPEVIDLASSEADALLSGGIGEAFAAELRRFGDYAPTVRALLAPLAWAEGLGLPGRGVWLAVANAMAARNGVVYTDADLATLIDRAGMHIVASSEDHQTVYRLYHQSYSDFFRTGPGAHDLAGDTVHAWITEALVGLVEHEGVRHWHSANPYLLRHLPAHAAIGGGLARLCDDADFLIHVDPVGLRRVLATLDHRRNPLVRLYWRALSDLFGTTPQQRLDILGAVALREEPDAIGLLNSAVRPTWRPLWSYCRPTALHRPLGGHRMPAMAVELGRLGGQTMLVSGGGDHTVRLWDPVSGERRGTFVGHRAPVLAVAVTTVHGRGMIISGDALGVLHVWDTANGQCLATLHTRRGAVHALAVVPDGDDGALCVAEEGSVIRVWRLSDRALLAELPDHCTTVRTLAVHHDIETAAPVLISGGDDGRIGVWNTRSWRLTRMIDTTGYPLAVAATRVDGHALLAIGGYWGTLSIWNLDEGTIRTSLRGHDRALNSLAFGTVENHPVLATAGDDGGVRVWSPKYGTLLRTIRSTPPIRPTVLESITREQLALGPAGGAVAVEDERNAADRAIAPHQIGDAVQVVRFVDVNGQQTLVTGGIDGAIRLWDIDAGESATEGAQVAVTSVAIGQINGRPVVIAADRVGDITVRDLDTGAPTLTLSHSDSPVGTVLIGDFLGRRRIVAVGGGRLRSWDADTGEPMTDLSGQGAEVLGATFIHSYNGGQLAYAAGRSIHLVSCETGARTAIRAGQHPPVHLACLPSSGLLVGDLRGSVRLLQRNGQVDADLYVAGLSAAPLGLRLGNRRLVIVTGRHGTVVTHHLDTNDPTVSSFVHTSTITALAYGDVLGGVVAAGGTNGAVTLSDPLTGEHRLDLPSHHGPVRALSFGRTNGTPTLVSAGDEGIQAIQFTDP